ncbi:MAG: hypothetical protein ACPGVU_17050 [Limisphaerales bacterium]
MIASLASDHYDSVFLALQALDKVLPGSTEGISLYGPRAESRDAIVRLVEKLKQLDRGKQNEILKAYEARSRIHSPSSIEPWD